MIFSKFIKLNIKNLESFVLPEKIVAIIKIPISSVINYIFNILLLNNKNIMLDDADYNS